MILQSKPYPLVSVVVPVYNAEDSLFAEVHHRTGLSQSRNHRRFTLCAKTDDSVGFEAFLSDTAIRKSLSASGIFFFQKPEVYLKALALLHFPNMYYCLYGKADVFLQE